MTKITLATEWLGATSLKIIHMESDKFGKRYLYFLGLWEAKNSEIFLLRIVEVNKFRGQLA